MPNTKINEDDHPSMQAVKDAFSEALQKAQFSASTRSAMQEEFSLLMQMFQNEEIPNVSASSRDVAAKINIAYGRLFKNIEDGVYGDIKHKEAGLQELHIMFTKVVKAYSQAIGANSGKTK